MRSARRLLAAAVVACALAGVPPALSAQYGYPDCPSVFAAFAAAEAAYGYAFELDGYYFTGYYTAGDHYPLFDYYGHAWGPHGEDGGLWSLWCYYAE